MRRVVYAGALIATFPSIATAQVLTDENRPILCTDRYQGQPAVDTDALAMLIASQAGASMFLDGSNSAGIRDGAIQLNSTPAQPSEPVYAVVNAGLRSPASANRPFGPNVDLSSNEAAAAAASAMAQALSDLGFLMDDDVHLAGKVTYRVVRAPRLGSRLERAEADNPLILFRTSGPVVLCETAPQIGEAEPQQGGDGEQERPPSSFQVRPVLRGSVEDLSVPSSDLKDADAAKIAYSSDDIADTKTFELDAVAGLRIASRSGAFEAIPYLSYERKSITGDEGDIEILSPGLLVAWHFERPEFGVHTRLEASFIDDMEQGSHQGKLRLYIDPALWLGPGNGVLFGGNLPQFRPLLLRPRLTIIADVSNVYRAGTSEELAEADDYWALGAELSLRARLALGSPISDFVLTGGVRHLELFGDIELDQARRWFGSLEYAPEAFPYVGLALEFNDGRNDDTFQQEDTYSIALRLRY